MVENPVKDSPKTPTTPTSPENISRSATAPILDTKKSPFDLRKEPLTEGLKGTWRIKQNHGPHRDVRAFKPASAADAIAFLSHPTFQLPSGVSRLCDTPLSSRSVKWAGREDTMQTCHGCHGSIGAGTHIGSATGKNNCIFVHSLACLGGIVEDATWKSCPDHYTFQGFDQTLYSQDFHTPQGPANQHSQAMAPPVYDGVDHVFGQQVYNTPTLSEEQLSQDRDRLQRQHNGEGSRQKESHHVTSDMQRQMDSHRAENQAQASNLDRPPQNGLTISDLRADPKQQEVVSEQISGFRERIPSLSAAPTAGVPAAAPQPSNPSQSMQDQQPDNQCLCKQLISARFALIQIVSQPLWT